MDDIRAIFSLEENDLTANFSLTDEDNLDAVFRIDAAGTTWGSIDGNIANQTDLQNELNSLSDQIAGNHSEITNIELTMQGYGDIVTHNTTEFATATEGTLASTALQPGDNITELTNNAGYITGINSLDVISALGYTPQRPLTPGYGISLNNNTVSTSTTIASKTDIGDADLVIKENNTSLGTFSANATSPTTINISVPTTATEVGALPSDTTIDDLTNTAQQAAINSGANSTNIGQISTNTSAIATNTSDISTINGKIPNQASSSNQLADKNFVNSSIATNTANFIGTFQSVADLEAYSGPLTNNDYAFVETTDTAGNTYYDRYKYTTATTPAEWQFEYELNNSSFTANQWAAINSGVTSGDVTLIGTALQPNDNISELTNNAGYITSASLPTVNNSTIKIQKNSTDVGIFTLNQSSGETINITVPTDTLDLTNGAGYITGITSNDVTTALGYTPYNSTNPNGYITGINSSDVTTALGYTPYSDSNPDGFITGINSSDVTTALGYTPQEMLVSGTNIKTVNNNSLLGSGNIDTPYRNIGEIVTSTMPLVDAGLHLLDGSLLQYGSYQAFIDYIADLYDSGDYTAIFDTEANWQQAVTDYGVCGKFVYDSVNNTVRLPKITGFIEGASGTATLGDLTEAGLPTHEHGERAYFDNPGGVRFLAASTTGGGSTKSIPASGNVTSGADVLYTSGINNSVYGNSNTVQPQSVKVLYYIVVATTTKTAIEVDIDEIATDLNGKADVDLSNITNTSSKNFDGQWVFDDVTLYEGNTPTSTDVNLDLSNYLPNDNYDYLVSLNGFITTASGAGNRGLLQVITDKTTTSGIYVAGGVAGSSTSGRDWGNTQIVVGTGRYINILKYAKNTGNCGLYLKGYRRLGTNI